jgi:hypothetical protein
MPISSPEFGSLERILARFKAVERLAVFLRYIPRLTVEMHLGKADEAAHGLCCCGRLNDQKKIIQTPVNEWAE